MLKICTWNINGIRSFSKPFKPHLDKLDADIICLQETKAGRMYAIHSRTIPYIGDLIANYSRVDGYNAYFAHCKLKPGYSGLFNMNRLLILLFRRLYILPGTY